MAQTRKGDSASAQGVAKGMAGVKGKVNDIATDSTFNVDKTGLFFKLQPKNTYEGLDLHSCFKRMGNVPNDSDFKEVVSKLSKLNQELDARDSLYNQKRDVVGESADQKWLHIEEDKKILEMLVQDAAQAMQPVEHDG